jgi:heme/copper-type cytochrome/quinol oxidase subunit 2
VLGLDDKAGIAGVNATDGPFSLMAIMLAIVILVVVMMAIAIVR